MNNDKDISQELENALLIVSSNNELSILERSKILIIFSDITKKDNGEFNIKPKFTNEMIEELIEEKQENLAQALKTIRETCLLNPSSVKYIRAQASKLSEVAGVSGYFTNSLKQESSKSQKLTK